MHKKWIFCFLHHYLKMGCRVIVLYCCLLLFTDHYYSCMQCSKAIIAFWFLWGKTCRQCLAKCSHFLKEDISLLTSMLLSPHCDSTLRFILKFNRNNLRDFFYYDDQIFLTIQWLIDLDQQDKCDQHSPDNISTRQNINGSVQAYLMLMWHLTNPLLYLRFLLRFLWLMMTSLCLLTHLSKALPGSPNLTQS